MNHTERDIAIYTQVAFKAACDMKPDLDTPEGKTAFEEDVVYLAGLLIDLIEVNAAKHASAAAAPSAPKPSGGTPATTGGLRVKGEQHGPIPQWAIDKAAELGVTEVWDNRQKRLEKPQLPVFKAVDQDIPFWDPDSPRPARGGRRS